MYFYFYGLSFLNDSWYHVLKYYLPPTKPVCSQEATVRLRFGTMDRFKIGKGVCQGCILSPWSFNFYAKYIMWNTGLPEAQAGIKTAWRNINNLRYADDTTVMEESKEDLKCLLMKVKEENEKAGLKLNIKKKKKRKIMASGPITSWHIDRKKWKQWQTIFLDSKITMDGDCNHITRCLLPGRKTMTNLDCVLKSRDITLLTKFCMVKAMVFPVVMYGCESWTPKRLSTKEFIPSNCGAREDSWEPLGQQGDQTQSILKEINPKYSLKGLVLKLKLQYFGLMWRANTLEKTLMLERLRVGENRQQRMRCLNGIMNALDMSLSKLWEMVGREAWHAAVHGVTKNQTQLSNYSNKWNITSRQDSLRVFFENSLSSFFISK